jgi:hypothetical protein
MGKIIRNEEHVRESSLVFKEENFGYRKWHIETPTNGLANLMPFFAFNTMAE